MTGNASPSGVELLDEWATWMLAAGMSERTVKLYDGVVRQAARSASCDPAAFSGEALAGWLSGFEVPATLATYSRALRSWHRWLLEQEHRCDDPMARMRRPRQPGGVPRPVSTAALEQLIAHASHHVRLMVLLAAYQGLRVHEIAKIRGEDIDLDQAALTVVGKGGKHARLPLHPAVGAVAKAMPARGWWFPSTRYPGKHISYQSVSRSIGRAMRGCEVQATPHALRHWYATNLLREGADIRVVQTLMRHSSLATTERYLAVSDEDRLAAVLRLPSAPPSEATAPGVAPGMRRVEPTAVPLGGLLRLSSRPTSPNNAPPVPQQVARAGPPSDEPRWGLAAWDHFTLGGRPGACCAVCGPLSDGLYRVDDDGRSWCLLFVDPAPSAEERAQLGCPDWCSPNFHDRDDQGALRYDGTHSADLGEWTGLNVEDGAPVMVTLWGRSDFVELTPEQAQQVAIELLNAAAAARAAKATA